MSWDGKQPHGGFSATGGASAKPWMKAHPLSGEIDVASQVDDPRSVLSFWKKMLKFRGEHADGLVYGDFDIIGLEDPSLFSFVKTSKRGDKYLVVLNFSGAGKAWDRPGPWELGVEEGSTTREAVSLNMLVSTVDGHDNDGGDDMLLSPYEGRVYAIAVGS
jgi:oligo-1,6-glucosidase